MRDNAVNARIDAADKITVFKTWRDVVANDCRGQTIRQHGFQAIAHLNPHSAFIGGNDQDCAIVLLGLAFAILTQCPFPTKPISIIRYLIAFETAQRCHHQLTLGSGFQPSQFGRERGLLLWIQ